MREVSPQIARYALVGVLIVFILGACVQPVTMAPFLEDKKVQETIAGGNNPAPKPPDPPPPPPPDEPGVKVQLTFTNEGKIDLTLNSTVTGNGRVDSPITLFLPPATPSTARITLTNTVDASSNIQWYCEGTTALQDNMNNYYDVNTAIVTSPFNTPGMYQLSVVCMISGKPCHGDVYIKVVP